MSGYFSFASFYDTLTSDIDYEATADFYDGIFKKFGKPEILLDLACGTGSLSCALSKRGYDVIGCDASEDMLSCAMSKNASGKILFLCQDACSLDLFGTVQGAVCNLDSVNHFEPDELEEAFAKVSLFMEKDGIFVFDVDSKHKFTDILSDNTFIYDYPDVYCIWQNSYEDEVLSISLDFFVPDKKSGKYSRIEDGFEEYYYSDELLCEVLDKTGFDIILKTADFTMNPPDKESQRIHYITRKRG